jgi:hypothetical protein
MTRGNLPSLTTAARLQLLFLACSQANQRLEWEDSLCFNLFASHVESGHGVFWSVLLQEIAVKITG